MRPSPEPNPRMVAPSGEKRSGARPGPFVGRTVLVVDADRDHRELVEAILDRVGARALLAADVPSAIELLRRGPVDAVLTDLALPVKDGYAVLAAVREHDPKVPVVALSAFVARPGSAPTRHAAFDGFLMKPAEPAKLCAFLAARLRLREDGDAG